MIEIRACATSCEITRTQLLTVGSRGIKARFTIVGELAGLDLTACWRAGRTRFEVPISGDGAVTEVPAGLLTTPGDMVEVGVYGAGPHRRIPTVWAKVGEVRRGTAPTAGEHG